MNASYVYLIAAIVAVAAGWFFVLRKERSQKLAHERRRTEVLQRHAQEAVEEIDYSEFDAAEAASTRPEFRFAFSIKELLGAMTVAALTFGLVRGLGGPESAAILLGSIALLGLVIHLLGFDPAPVIILGWWLLLVLYIVVSLWAAFGSDSLAWAVRNSNCTRRCGCR